MQPLPQLLPKGAPPPPSSALAQLAKLPQFAEPATQTVKLGLNLLPVDAIPEPASAVAAAPATASLGLVSIGSAVALALGIVLATPEATADEDAILERLRREDELVLQPVEAPSSLQTEKYPFFGGQADGVVYAVRFNVYRADGSLWYYYGYDHYGPIGGVRLFIKNGVNEIQIFGRGLYELGNTQYPIQVEQGWYGGFAANTEMGGSIGPVIVYRLDGKSDIGNPPPLTQAISSPQGQTLSSLAPYQRKINDRPIPASALQPKLAPISAPQKSSLPDFAEPEPRLQTIPNLLPAPDGSEDPPTKGVPLPLPIPNLSTDTAPEVNNNPQKNPAPSLTNPNSVTLISPASNPQNPTVPLAVSPIPFSSNQLMPVPINPIGGPPMQLANPNAPSQPQQKPEPAPEKNTLETIKDQVGNLTTALGLVTVTITQIANRTTPEALKNAANAGNCEAFGPNGCNADIRENARNGANNSANNSNNLERILNNTSNLADLALLPIINNKLGNQITGGIGPKLKNFVDWAVVDRVVNLVTMTAALHNVFMLTNSISDTFFEAVDNVLAIPALINNPDADTVDSKQAITGFLDKYFAQLFGVSEWSALKSQWKAFSTISSTTAQAYNNLREIHNDSQELLNQNRNYTAQLGNALTDEGVISEDNWDYKDPNQKIKSKGLNRLERMANGLEAVENSLEAIEQVTATLRNITETANEIKENVAAIDKAVNDANQAAKEDREAKIEGLELPNFSLDDLF